MVASHAPPTGDLTWPATQACALIGNQTSDPLVLRTALSPLSHMPHQTGLFIQIFIEDLMCSRHCFFCARDTAESIVKSLLSWIIVYGLIRKMFNGESWAHGQRTMLVSVL